MLRCFNVPGLRNSGPAHWQSEWERRYPDTIGRIQQQSWAAPDRQAWVDGIAAVINAPNAAQTILIGHSIGCAAIVHWFRSYQLPLAGAILVAPSDPDRPDYPSYITGFSPMPLKQLPFASTVIVARDDHVVSTSRAKLFAQKWGSSYQELTKGGHLETEGNDQLNQLITGFLSRLGALG